MILDLFAGPGGWSEGLRALDRRDFGIEKDAAAAATRYAAGHATLVADLAELDPLTFSSFGVEGLIGSPPCQSFSSAGKQTGLADKRGQLVWVPMEWALTLRPRWVALEQVPQVLPIWKHVARVLEQHGYWTWTGVVQAADFGVPQTRERAILLAHRGRPVSPPEPTHAKVEEPESMFGPGRSRWVSMAEGLGWAGPYALNPGLTPSQPNRRLYGLDEPSPTIAFGHDAAGWEWVVRTGNNTMKHSREGSKAGDGGVVAYERSLDEPAPTLDTMTGAKWTIWCYQRPATAVCCDPRLASPGFRMEKDERAFPAGRTFTTEEIQEGIEAPTEAHAIKITVAEALALQSFRPDYPLQGSKTKQFEQVGNAIPPQLATVLLRQVIA